LARNGQCFATTFLVQRQRESESLVRHEGSELRRSRRGDGILEAGTRLCAATFIRFTDLVRSGIFCPGAVALLFTGSVAKRASRPPGAIAGTQRVVFLIQLAFYLFGSRKPLIRVD
jgi:hypothetical protein